MYCTNCGSQIPDDARFCENCGCKVEEEISVNPYATQGGAAVGQNSYGNPGADYGRNVYAGGAYGGPKKKKNKKLIGLIVGIIALAAVAAVCLFLFLNRKPAINLNDYMTISAEGVDGYGTAVCEFDYEAFEQKNAGKIKINEKNSEIKAYMSLFGADNDALVTELAQMSISYELDKTSNLSNGDIVTLTWNCDMLEEYFNCKFKYSDIEYTVKGLTEMETFDPFEGVDVEFSGTAPNGYADIIVNSGSEAVNSLYYSLDKNNGLSNGDVVTVTISYGNDVAAACAEDFGMVPSETSKEYTVEGLDSYTASIDGITANTENLMKNQAQNAFTEYVKNMWVPGEEFVEKMTYLGKYFLAAEDRNAADQNVCYLVYKIDVINNDGKLSFYYYTAFYNITSEKDGVQNVDLNRYTVPTGTKDIFGNVTGEDFIFSDNYYYDGYLNLEDMEAYVKSLYGNYTFESDVKE